MEKMRDSLGGRARVRLDVDAPDLGVEVERFERTVAGEVLELVDVLRVSTYSALGQRLEHTSLPP